jgi:GNAT superfamily N-acetyltransferase
MTITYRAALPADAATLDRIFDTSFCETFGHLYRAEDLAMFRSSFGISEWAAQLADPAYAFRIGEVDGEAAGFVKLGPLKLPVAPIGPALLLDQLYILKAHHGTGIAQGLMSWVLDEASRRGVGELFLTVFVDNHRARRFYDGYGFEAVGRYDFMVGNHADEDIIMRKVL